MQPTVESIESVSVSLRSSAEPSFGDRLKSDVETVLARWAATIELARRHTAGLTGAVADTRALFADLGTLDSALDDIQAAHLSCELIVHNEVELGQYINNFQV